jgi:hypothetical protein
MAWLRIASLATAVVSGDYAVLMLVNGQLVGFGVTATICAGSFVVAGLIACAARRPKTAARGRAAVWERRRVQQAAAAYQQCLMCGAPPQKPSESPRFVDRQAARLCGGCAAHPQTNVRTLSPGWHH